MTLLTLAVLVTMAADPSPSPAEAVRVFYGEVVKRHPLGDTDRGRQARPVAVAQRRLARTLDTLQACENDYFEGNRRLFTPAGRPAEAFDRLDGVRPVLRGR